MTGIPESVMQIADRITETILFEHVRFRRTSRRGAPSAIEMDVELVKLSIASAILAAEKRGEEMERGRWEAPRRWLAARNIVTSASVYPIGNEAYRSALNELSEAEDALAAAIRKGQQ